LTLKHCDAHSHWLALHLESVTSWCSFTWNVTSVWVSLQQTHLFVTVEHFRGVLH